MPQDANDVRDYSNVQHSVHTFYNHTFVGKHILTVGGDYMRDYVMDQNGRLESLTFTDVDELNVDKFGLSVLTP